jgi:ribosomal protein S18 acetylase RimI-like enzyme
MTTQERLAMMSVPGYEAALDLVAIASGGQIVAYCMCSIRREENRMTGRNDGYTDPIATRPQFQRRGLGRALLLTGMRALRARGAEVAILGTTSENTAMLRTATAVGFRVRSTTVWFAKEIASKASDG